MLFRLDASQASPKPLHRAVVAPAAWTSKNGEERERERDSRKEKERDSRESLALVDATAAFDAQHAAARSRAGPSSSEQQNCRIGCQTSAACPVLLAEMAQGAFWRRWHVPASASDV